MTESLIRLESVKKVFFTDEVETHALDNVNIEIGKGEYVSIAGPSGCGKSTLLSILGLLDTPTEGLYVLNGRKATDLSLPDRARVRNREVGFIFQSFNLIGDLNVYENVELPLTYRGMRTTERKQRVTAALERVGMAHRSKHLPNQLSGGQQQRVAVARAVSGEPSILLADEPTGNLDSKNGEAVMDLLGELHKGGAPSAWLRTTLATRRTPSGRFTCSTAASSKSRCRSIRKVPFRGLAVAGPEERDDRGTVWDRGARRCDLGDRGGP